MLDPLSRSGRRMEGAARPGGGRFGTTDRRGAELVDIMSHTSTRPAVLNKDAPVRDGLLTYPPHD
ncbi:hypothetical protein [Streptomyces sp. NPDC005547]|uniref:hypothetical protein n=2 Tax=unclassified Streptomyces TaxID=2593676 RepID=UPI0033A0A3DF